MTAESDKVKQKRFGIKRKRLETKRKRNTCQPVSTSSSETCQPSVVSTLDACQPLAVSGKRRRRKSQPLAFSEKELKDELLRQAKALKIPSGTAELIASKVATRVRQWISQRSVVTVDDVYRRIAAEVEKYSADLAYVYQNRGKII